MQILSRVRLIEDIDLLMLASCLDSYRVQKLGAVNSNSQH